MSPPPIYINDRYQMWRTKANTCFFWDVTTPSYQISSQGKVRHSEEGAICPLELADSHDWLTDERENPSHPKRMVNFCSLCHPLMAVASSGFELAVSQWWWREQRCSKHVTVYEDLGVCLWEWSWVRFHPIIVCYISLITPVQNTKQIPHMFCERGGIVYIFGFSSNGPWLCLFFVKPSKQSISS